MQNLPDDAVRVESPVRYRMSNSSAFWLLSIALGLLLFASAAPSPMYPVYQQMWHYSSVVSTGVYAANAIALLVTLLFAGSLSDHIGRRPVLIAAVLVELTGTLTFAEAQSVTWLFTARIVQGIATGLATGAITATLIDLQPAESRLGALMTNVAAGGGLAVGAISSGLLVAYAPAPTRLVYWLLAVAFTIIVIGVLVIPETVAPDGRGWESLEPKVSVPQEVRVAFMTLMPSIAATWALGGLYLALGGTLMKVHFHVSTPLAGGLVVVALQGTSAVTALLARDWTIDQALLRGPILLMSGVALALLGAATNSVWLFFGASVVAGVGFGPSFSGALRLLTGLSPAETRAEVVTAIYVVSYLSLSVPAVIAGLCVQRFGLAVTTYGYGLIVIAMEALALIGSARHRNPHTALAGHLCPAPCPGSVAPMPRVVSAHP
ncbi:MFS transporter [Nocardia aurantiaca]|uniref:MFS transporter n=1 Tax=Nocardia aurantiaca TaxID=2675850 RepID=A0A6I3L4G8_9NOCA|nr:MFS transporter [Nocardia aurantiaca]MTE17242.1 MFS transporter [Nocardia aurantiaca]